jgi:hypothetical protein
LVEAVFGALLTGGLVSKEGRFFGLQTSQTNRDWPVRWNRAARVYQRRSFELGWQKREKKNALDDCGHSGDDDLRCDRR